MTRKVLRRLLHKIPRLYVSVEVQFTTAIDSALKFSYTQNGYTIQMAHVYDPQPLVRQFSDELDGCCICLAIRCSVLVTTL